MLGFGVDVLCATCLVLIYGNTSRRCLEGIPVRNILAQLTAARSLAKERSEIPH